MADSLDPLVELINLYHEILIKEISSKTSDGSIPWTSVTSGKFTATVGAWDFDIMANAFELPDLEDWGIKPIDTKAMTPNEPEPDTPKKKETDQSKRDNTDLKESWDAVKHFCDAPEMHVHLDLLDGYLKKHL